VRAAPAPAALPPSAQYVAVLQKERGAPAFILTVDGATRNFTVRKLDAAAEPAKSFELWLISDKLPQPRSLGVIGTAISLPLGDHILRANGNYVYPVSTLTLVRVIVGTGVLVALAAVLETFVSI